MRQNAELCEGVYLHALEAGSTIDIETRRRRYQIEYLEGDRIRISGHPQWCPTPTLARLCGSRGGSVGFADGYIGCRMQLAFVRLDDRVPVTTSEVTHIRVVDRHWADRAFVPAPDLPSAGACVYDPPRSTPGSTARNRVTTSFRRTATPWRRPVLVASSSPLLWQAVCARRPLSDNTLRGDDFQRCATRS